MKVVFPKSLTAAQKAKKAKHARRMSERNEQVHCKYCLLPVKIGKIDNHEQNACPSRPR